MLDYCSPDLPADTSPSAPETDPFADMATKHHHTRLILGAHLGTTQEHQIFEAETHLRYDDQDRVEYTKVKLPLNGTRKHAGYFTGEEGIAHLVDEEKRNDHSLTGLFKRNEPQADYSVLYFHPVVGQALTSPDAPLAKNFNQASLAHIIVANTAPRTAKGLYFLRGMTTEDKAAGFWATSDDPDFSEGNIVTVLQREDSPRYEVRRQFQRLASSMKNYIRLTGMIKHIWPAMTEDGQIIAGAIVGSGGDLKHPTYLSDTLVAFKIDPAIVRRYGSIEALKGKGINGISGYKSTPVPFARADGNLPNRNNDYSLLLKTAGTTVPLLERVKVTDRIPARQQTQQISRPFFL